MMRTLFFAFIAGGIYTALIMIAFSFAGAAAYFTGNDPQSVMQAFEPYLMSLLFVLPAALGCLLFGGLAVMWRDAQ